MRKPENFKERTEAVKGVKPKSIDFGRLQLTQQLDGSGYNYGIGKRVEPTTGAERLQHGTNDFLDDLQRITQNARMEKSGEGSSKKKKGRDGQDKKRGPSMEVLTKELIKQEPHYKQEIEKQAREWQAHEKEQKKEQKNM